MQALYKMVASFLSVALIFTSVAPSFAQTRSNSPFKVSGSNALGDAVNRHVTQTLEKAEDAYWVERGTKLVATQQRVVTLPYIVETLEKAKENAPKQDILQAQVCDKENLNCVPALAYAWGGVHYAAKNLLYYQDKPIIETAPQLATLITEYGLHSEQDRQAVRTYFYKLIKEADSDCDSGFMKRYLEVGSESNRVDARQANANKAKRCQAEVSVLPALAMIEKTPHEKQLAAKEIYSLLKSDYDQDQGAEIMYSAVTALGVLDTEQAYRYLDRFLTQDTIPSVAGNVWEGLWSPGKSTAQNSLRAASNIRGGNSRYLNRINEQFQYLDKAEAKRQGFNNTAWQSEGRQYPYGNVLEEIGVFLGQQSASSPFAKNLAKKLVAKANEAAISKTNAAGTLHYPVVLGILDGWRAHGKQFIFVPDPALLSLFYKGDWFDINEGTQRRIHYKVWQFAQLRGYTGWKAPQLDKEKNQRYIHNARILGMGQAADVVAPLFVAEGLFRVVPALAKGIPGAVRTLRAHKAWVGTKNYLKNAKVAKPVAKEVPLKPAPAAQQVTPKSTKSAQLSVAKVDNNTVQILPKGYTVEQLNPGRTNIAPKTFASTGDGVAPGKPLSNAKQAKADKFQYKSQRQQDKRIYKEAEEMMQPAQTAPAAPRTLSWKDKARFQWEANFKPAFQNLFKFGTSRYGLSALGTGAAPVTSEAAIMANTPVIAQTVRAQQSTFIAEEFLRGGAGASYRVGAVNSGGVAAAHYAQAALNAVNPATQAAKILAMSVGASRTAQTVAPRYGNGMAYSLVFPVPSFIMNRLLRAPMPADDGSETAGGGRGKKASKQERKKEEYLAELPVLLQRLESYAALHDGKLHPTKQGGEDYATYEKAVAGINYLKKHGLADHPLVAHFSTLIKVAAQKQADRKRTKQQKDASQNKELMMLKAYLSKLEEFAREHDNRLPEDNPVAKGYDLRKQVTDRISSLKARKVLENDDPLIQRYERLVEADRLQQYKQVRMSDEDGTESVESGNATSTENVTETKKQENDPSSIQKLAQIYQGGNARSSREQRKVDRVVKRLAERLPQLEEFARKHNGRLPQTSATTSLVNYTTEDEASLINSIARDIDFLEGQGFRNDPLSQRYAVLVEGHKNYLVTNLSAALDQLEEYARAHNGNLPYKSTSKNYGTEQDLLLREQTVQNINLLKNLIAGKSWEKHDHTLAKRCEPLFQRYDRLNQAHQQKLKDERNAVLRAERQAAQEGTKQRKLQQKEDKRREEEDRQQIQKEWEEEQARLEKQARIEEAAVRRQDKEWAQYEEALADETTADRAARVADNRIAWLGQTTEDFIVQLVNFYNNINPFGNAELNIRFNKPGRWADELEKFIDKNRRAPVRYAEEDINSQEMKDEQRLAKAVYGLSDRLPADNPDKIRIDELFASVGVNMDKESRAQRVREQRLSMLKKGRQSQVAARRAHQNQKNVAQGNTSDPQQGLEQAEQEIQNALRETSAAQAASQNWLDAQLDEIENEWAEEEDIYNSMRQTSAAQVSVQASLDAQLDEAEAEFNTQEKQKKQTLKKEQVQMQPVEKPTQKVTLSSLEKAISQFIALPMPFFLFEGILQNIFTTTDAKVAALADTHTRGRRPGYASLWLKTAEEEKYDVKNLGLIKLAKDKQSPLQLLFKLREEAQKAAPKQAATAQETAVEQTVPETPVPAQENPAPSGSQLLTGIDGLKAYFPNWRTQLSVTKAGFSKKQLDAIEQAFAATDEAMFEKDADGNLIYNPSRSKEAWNYSQTFTDILDQSGISFTPNQYRQIVGGVGAQGFTLASIFRLYENMAFMLSQQRKPQKAIYQDSKDITSQIKAQAKLDTQAAKKNTPAQLQVEEVQLGIRTSVLLTSLRKAGQENSPIYQAFNALQDPFNTQKSYEEWFALLKEFTDTYHRWPHQAFSREEESKIPLEQQIKEKQLATAANRSMSRLKAAGMENSPIYQAFKQLQEKYRTRKTPEEWIALLERFTTQYKRWPRAHISENDIIITDQIQRQAKLDTEHGLTNTQAQQIWAEVQLGQAMNALSGQWKKTGQTNTPLYQRFKVLKDRYGATFRQPKSSQELWEEVSEYVTSNKKFPLSRSVIGKALDSRLRYYQSAMVDGKYVDPWLQQLYELKLAVQAAPTGKFTITPDGKGSYVLEIAPEALQEIAVEEAATTKVTAPKPTHHSIRLRVSNQIKQAMENAQEQDALERRNFSKWVWTMNSLDYRNLLINRETSNALYNIARNVKADDQKHIARLKVTYLVNTLNNIRKVLNNSTAQTYYRLIYQGTVAENKLPVANNFHIVAEEKGIARQEQIAKQAESLLAKHPELSVFIDERNKTHITRIGLKKNASIDQAAKDLQSLITQLTPAGYVYRMGEHELGLSGNLDNFRHGNVHLHLESIANDPTEEGLFVDISLTLDISAWRFAGWYNKNKEFEPYFDKKIAENYQKLFAPYLNEEGKQALIKIATSKKENPASGGGGTPTGPHSRR